MNLGNAFSKVEDIVDYLKEYDISDIKELSDIKDLRRLLKKNAEIEEKRKNNTLIWILAIIGAIVVCCAIGYCIYKFLIPDYLDDFEDEDFEDDFFDEDDDLTAWEEDEDDIKLEAEEDKKEASDEEDSKKTTEE